jgi:methionine biosynthesis protein MetW
VKPQLEKIEHQAIMDWIEQDSSVLDLGCGDGDLLTHLIYEKKVHAQGIEISAQAIHRCVARGLSVLQEDIDSGLADYENESFDYVVLNQTLQQVKKPDFVLHEALRVGKKVIIGFPNFLYISARFQMFFGGKVPVTSSLPYVWFDTPNLHFLSVADFREYCERRKIRILDSVFLRKNKRVRFFPNLFAETALFLLTKHRFNIYK